MKKDIHPTFYRNTVVTCSCGNVFTTGATKQTLRVELVQQVPPLLHGRAAHRGHGGAR